LRELDALRPDGATQQAMLVRRYTVPDPTFRTLPGDQPCTYLVAYEGEADDLMAWLTHYIADHPPIMARFPGIRQIEIYTCIDWCGGLPWPRVAHMQRNKVVFDNQAALTAALNSARTHIVPLMFAAMPDDGEFEFEYSDSGYCNGGYHAGVSRWTHGHFSKLRVQGRNLGAYLRATAPNELSSLRYVKIDTEGFDRAVVQSLSNLLTTVRPYIKTEIYRHLPDEERRGYHVDLRKLGYRTFKWESDELYWGAELSVDDFSRWKHFDVFAVPEELA
jgi:hypothetical protein